MPLRPSSSPAPSSSRLRVGAVLVAVVFVVLATAPPSTTQAEPAPQRAPVPSQSAPPDDDNSPESDRQPLPGGRSAGRLATPLPQTPPTDNAFPIRGATRSACSDSFGDPRSGGRTHLGVDCFGSLGTPLIAVESGVIRYATPAGPYDCTSGGDGSGNRVSIRGHSGYVYYYGHLDTILVATEQPVEKGQIIGTMGRTGNAACSGVHLHFEVKCGENGDAFDPYPVLANWGSPTPPPAIPSTERQGAGVVWSGASRADLFTLECGEAIRQRTWYSSAGLTAAWSVVDGIATSDPDAASGGPGALPQAFVRGLDNAAYQLSWTGSTWQPVNLGGTCTSGPTAVYTNPNHLELFCRGSDQALWARIWDASTGFSGWVKVGGILTSDPDAASYGPEYPADVFVRGNDGAVYQMYVSEVGWTSVNLGGYCTSGPSATYSGPDRLDVFCRGSDLALYHRFWSSGTGWSPAWSRIESRILSDPDAFSLGAGRPAQVVVRGMDRRLYQFQWNGSAWTYSLWGFT